MLLLRVLLTSLLVASITWGSFIAFGPLFIGWAVKILTSGELRLSSIKVKPDLTVHIPRAELLNKDETVWAFSRGLEVTWSFDDGRFNFDVHTGPTASTSKVYASNVNLNVQPNAFTDWSSVQLQLTSENIQFGDEEVTAKRLHASGIYTPPKNILRSSSWVFEDLTQPQLGVEISKVSFTMPPLSPDAELPLNEVFESLIASEITVPSLEVSVESASTRLEETAVVPQLEIVGKNFSSELYGLTADTVNLTMPLPLDQNLETPKKLFFERLRASDWLVGDLSANYASVGASDFELSGVLNVDKFKLSLRNVYVGDFSNSTLNFVAQSKSVGDVRTLLGSVAAEIGAERALRSATVFEITGFDQFCHITECNVERILITNEISAADERVSGISECFNEACLALNFSHQFRTENTNRLFSNLKKANIFNPLALIGVRAFVNQSPRSGAGHIINF